MSHTPADLPTPSATTSTATDSPGSQPGADPQLSGRNKFLGAMFLMATSAIGPGFITQTVAFTDQLAAAFAFAIVVSILFDIAIQLNVWRVIGVSGRRAQDLANGVVPGAGYVLSALDVIGGLVFNIGNIAGCSLGLNAIFGLDVRVGAAISALVAIGIFLVRRAGVAMDRVVVLLGLVMIGLTTFVAIKTQPPLGDALAADASHPETASFLVITTLIGGTVGGYIVYAGAHRLVDNGIKGVDYVPQITRSSITGVDDHRRHAGAAVPRRPRRRGRWREARRPEPRGRRLRPRPRRDRQDRLRRDHVVGGHHLGDRRVVHLHLVPQGARPVGDPLGALGGVRASSWSRRPCSS